MKKSTLLFATAILSVVACGKSGKKSDQNAVIFPSVVQTLLPGSGIDKNPGKNSDPKASLPSDTDPTLPPGADNSCSDVCQQIHRRPACAGYSGVSDFTIRNSSKS